MCHSETTHIHKKTVEQVFEILLYEFWVNFSNFLVFATASTELTRPTGVRLVNDVCYFVQPFRKISSCCQETFRLDGSGIVPLHFTGGSCLQQGTQRCLLSFDYQLVVICSVFFLPLCKKCRNSAVAINKGRSIEDQPLPGVNAEVGQL